MSYYDYHFTVAVANDSDDPVIVPVTLPTGILRRIIIFFPPGCLNHVRVRIDHESVPIYPNNGYICGNDTYFDTRDLFFEFVFSGLTNFTINAWNDGVDTENPHSIDVYLAVEEF